MKLTLQGCIRVNTHAGTYICAHMYTIEGHTEDCGTVGAEEEEVVAVEEDRLTGIPVG